MADDIIHRDKLFGGRETANEVHRRVVWGHRKCSGCGSKPVVMEIKSIVLISDLSPTLEAAIRLAVATGDPEAPAPFDTPDGKAVVAGRIWACAHCRKTAIKEAAKGPSYVRVYVDDGVGEDKPLVSVV